MNWRSRISNKLPPILYSLFAVPFWFLHPDRESVFLVPNGNSWHVKKKDLEFFVPIWERTSAFSEKRPYQRFCKITSGDTVVDAGAGIGMDTAPMAKAVGEEGEVIAIEPHPVNLEYLRKNVNTNSFDNVNIIEGGLWSEKGFAELFVDDKFTGHSLIGKKILTNGEEKIEIQTYTLDDIFSELNLDRIQLIKMNIEGAEIEALKGAEETLQRTNNILVTIHRAGGFDTEQPVRELLNSEGFEIKTRGGHLFGKSQINS